MHTTSATWFFIILTITGCVIAVAAYFLLLREPYEQQQAIESFVACEAAGHFVIDTYPRQCQTPDGAVFFEESPDTQSGDVRQALPESNDVPDTSAQDTRPVTTVISGSVRDIDTAEIAFDGPVRMVLETETGEERVTIPSMGLPLCTAYEDIVSYDEIAVGDIVSVSGARGSDGAITPCDSSDHYLRLGAE